MRTQVLFSEEFDKHNFYGHPENAKRTTVLMHAVTTSPFYDDIELVTPRILSEKLLYEVHASAMIQRVKEIASGPRESWLDPDTYVCPLDYTTARLAAGGVLLLAKNIIEEKTINAFALVRPPGHHATKERSMGFCLFNNAAIAAHEMTKHVKRILIFDPDVHHGNGTQSIFYQRKDILYESFHLSPHFPGTGDPTEIGEGEGVGYTINAPLSYGNGNNAVTQLLDEIFLPIAEQFKPDLIIVSVGYDSHHADPLGGLKLTSDFYGEILRRLQRIQPKMLCTLEGGYNLQWIGKCLLSQLAQMTGNEISLEDTTHEVTMVKPLIKQLRKEMGSYWKI
jgi:acetoin utilization deacetylase AcuC-like enzyme